MLIRRHEVSDGTQREFSFKMQTKIRIIALALTVSIAILSGCGKKTDAATELSNTVKVLEKPDPGQQASAPQVAAPQTPNSPPTQLPPAQQVSQALTSLKAGKYADTIIYMESARSNPNKSPAQMMAIQDAMASVMNDLYTRAANGDAAARAAINKYNEERNRR